MSSSLRTAGASISRRRSEADYDAPMPFPMEASAPRVPVNRYGAGAQTFGGLVGTGGELARRSRRSGSRSRPDSGSGSSRSSGSRGSSKSKGQRRPKGHPGGRDPRDKHEEWVSAQVRNQIHRYKGATSQDMKGILNPEDPGRGHGGSAAALEAMHGEDFQRMYYEQQKMAHAQMQQQQGQRMAQEDERQKMMHAQMQMQQQQGQRMAQEDERQMQMQMQMQQAQRAAQEAYGGAVKSNPYSGHDPRGHDPRESSRGSSRGSSQGGRQGPGAGPATAYRHMPQASMGSQEIGQPLSF